MGKNKINQNTNNVCTRLLEVNHTKKGDTKRMERLPLRKRNVKHSKTLHEWMLSQTIAQKDVKSNPFTQKKHNRKNDRIAATAYSDFAWVIRDYHSRILNILHDCFILVDLHLIAYLIHNQLFFVYCGCQLFLELTLMVAAAFAHACSIWLWQCIDGFLCICFGLIHFFFFIIIFIVLICRSSISQIPTASQSLLIKVGLLIVIILPQRKDLLLLFGDCHLGHC